MTEALDKLRRRARQLNKAHALGEPEALRRVAEHPPRAAGVALKHADFLHVVAQEQGFASWPDLKVAVETRGYDRAQKQQRLKIAVFHGQNNVVQRLLEDTPDLADGLLGLQIALYDLPAVQAAIAKDPSAAMRALGPRTPILHLAYSRYIHVVPEMQSDMIAIAELLVANGADVNDAMPAHEGSDNMLSALYGAIGHADNMPLARWLLEHGANPDDGESLYHATELGHRDGVRLLIEHGVNPSGTNALNRALDFDDPEMLEMLLKAEADPNEYNAEWVGGEKPWVIPALHQAARRMRSGETVRLLLDAGANPVAHHEGVTPYALARVYGNAEAAVAFETADAAPPLTVDEMLLAAAAEGKMPEGALDESTLPEPYQHLIRNCLHLPGDRIAHVKGLIGLGLDFDRPDEQGLTAAQIAGWEGLPDMLAYLLSLGPNLDHINGYGGTYLSTIVHGSENCPERARRDHVGCARRVLEAGVPLPRRAVEFAGNDALAEFLAEWAADHPEQVTEDGVV